MNEHTTTNAVEQTDVLKAAEQLQRNGYVIVEGVLTHAEVEQWRHVLDELFALERRAPYEPGDGPSRSEDDEIEKFIAETYPVSPEELQRIMRRVRHTRANNYDTSWPVGPREINKSFLHIPNLFDHDRSQYIRNLPAKSELTDRLVENSYSLGLARHLLGRDCVMGDVSATSIGPGTDGGAWHVDAPLTQMPEPLPDFPLGIQVAWMIDDFTFDNGATRVVAESHLTRRRPQWKRGSGTGEVALCGPAGSIAVWLGSTWHRIGPNTTDRPRRAIISFYQRSWIKPFSDNRENIDSDRAVKMSSTVRYLYGFSANGLCRG